MMAGIAHARGRRMSAPAGQLPRWVEFRPPAAHQPRRRLPRLRAGRPVHRREPARGGELSDQRLARLWRGHRLHALLRHQLHLHRPLRRRRLPWRPVQHRRRGPGLCRRPRRRARLPAPRSRSLPWYITGAGGSRRRFRLRRRLGVHPGLAAGQARQPHRHHDDHVQFHRRGADGLPARQRPQASRAPWRRRPAPSPRAPSSRSSAG